MNYKKIITCLTAFATLCSSALPTSAVFAENTPTTLAATNTAIQLGTSALTGGMTTAINLGTYPRTAYATQPSGTENVDWIYDNSGQYAGPYFAIEPIQWRVLQNKDGKLFILSDETVNSIQYHTSDTLVTWETCHMRSWLNSTFMNKAFDSAESTLFADTNISTPDTVEQGSVGGNDTVDKLFLLTYEDCVNTDYGFSDIYASDYVSPYCVPSRMYGVSDYSRKDLYSASSVDFALRSPGYKFSDGSQQNVGCVHQWGGIDGKYNDQDGGSVDWEYGVRPGANLDTDKILYTVKTDTTSKNIYDKATSSEITANVDVFNLAIKDDTRNFAVTDTSLTGAAGGNVTVNYTGATVGSNEHISAIITDQSGNVLDYKQLGTVSQSNDSVTMTVPATLQGGTYTVKLFNESTAASGTIISSDFVSVPLTVGRVAPTITTTPKTVTFSGTTFDVSQLFTIPQGVTATYSIVSPTARTIDDVGEGMLSGNILTVTKAGKFTIKAETAESEAYLAGSATAVLTVEKGVPATTITFPTATSVVYGDTLANSTLTGGSDNGTFAWKTPDTVPTVANDGYAVVFTPNDTDLYDYTAVALESNVDITVAPRPVNIVWSGASTQTYDGNEKSVTATVSNALDGDSITPTLANATATEIGTYTAEVTAVDNANYTVDGGSNLTFEWNIIKKSSGSGGSSSGSTKPKSTPTPMPTATPTSAPQPTATPEPTAVPTVTEDTARFADVSESDWYYDAVQFAVENKIFNGKTDSVFAPNDIIDRGMFITVLYRLENEPNVAAVNTFADVPNDEYYAKAVAWGLENNIIAGISDEMFAPSNAITREQIATVLCRYLTFKGIVTSDDLNGLDTLKGYTDRDTISDYAENAMKLAFSLGLIEGKTATTMNPQDLSTRAETAVILKRFIENIG